jgi:hypothetical protein
MFTSLPAPWTFWYRTTAGSLSAAQSIGIINEERPKMTCGSYPACAA